MGCESGGRFGWLVAQVGGVGPGCERIRWGWLGRAGGVLVAVALVASVLVLSERAVVAQVVPSVGVSADAAGALEGDVLLFTVTASEQVAAGGSLDVVVSVSEDGNVDVDGDGTVEAGSGVLLGEQEGERSVTIHGGGSSAVFAVETVGAAGVASVTVTAAVVASDGGDYTADSSSVSASTVVRDDGAEAVVSWSTSGELRRFEEDLVATRPVEIGESDRLGLAVRVVTDAAVAPSGHFGVRVGVDPGASDISEYRDFASRTTAFGAGAILSFGSGAGAPSGAIPFALTADGLRYEAVESLFLYPVNDDLYELPETIELFIEATADLPATIRLGAGSASRLPVVVHGGDYALIDNLRVEPGDRMLSVSWDYGDDIRDYVTQHELQWRRSDQTDWPADGAGLIVDATREMVDERYYRDRSSATIAGLQNGVTYVIRIRPIVNDDHWLWSNFRDEDETTGTPTAATPSVGVSAAAAVVTEGSPLSFAVRADAPVSADLTVAVTVAEDANIDLDGDGTPDAATGVLDAAQEGTRTVTIPAGATEATFTVPTAADDTWENHATVTVTVSAPDGEAYTVYATAPSASTRVLDDDVPGGEVTLTLSDGTSDLPEYEDGFAVVEGDHQLVASIRFVTDGATEPHGVFGVSLGSAAVTPAMGSFVPIPDQTVFFGSGEDAPAGSAPFRLSEDGERYEATATVNPILPDDNQFGPDVTYVVALERTTETPSNVRLGAGDASGVQLTIFNDDLVILDEIRVESGLRRLVLRWGVLNDPHNLVEEYEVTWRRSDDSTTESSPRPLEPREPKETILGLENGVSYDIEVNAIVDGHSVGSVETIGIPGGVVARVVSGSRVVSGGRTVVRNVRITDQMGDAVPAFRVGGYVTFGPSAGVVVECLAEPLEREFEKGVSVEVVDYALTIDDHRRGDCVTNPVGWLTLVYPAAAVSTNSEILRRDFLWLYPDYNGDGVHQVLTEPAVRVGEPVRIVRPINYVALGDSYSAGQNGPRRHHGDFEGSYVDEDCARWSLSYPYLLLHRRRLQVGGFGHYSFNAIEAADIDSDGAAEDLPGFGFFACSGATTDELDAAAGQIAALSAVDGELQGADETAGESIPQGVDMVTLTIGGNDLRFAAGLTTCLLAECAEGRPVLQLGWPPVVSDALDFGMLGDRLNDVYEEITDAAGDASVFVLGYPNLVPEQLAAPPAFLDECAALNLTRAPREFALNALHALGHWLINAEIFDPRVVEAAVDAVSYVVAFSDQAGRLVINVTQDAVTFVVEGVPSVVDAAGRGAAYVAERGSDAISEVRRLEATAVQALIDGSEVVSRYTLEGAALVRGYLGQGWRLVFEGVKTVFDAGPRVFAVPSGLLPSGSSGVRSAEDPSQGPPVHVVEAIASVALISLDVTTGRIDDDERAYVRSLTRQLNELIETKARQNGVHFVPVASAFDGHEPCNAARQMLWGYGVEIPDKGRETLRDPVSPRSFHPTAAGHRAFAAVLDRFVRDAVRREISAADRAGRPPGLTTAGLPPNPAPQLTAAAATSSSGDATESPAGGTGQSTTAAAFGVIGARRAVAAAAGCVAAFVPGETVELAAGGFPAGATVSFSSVASTQTGTVLAAVAIPDATAGADGVVEVTWTVPAAPAGGTATLRWYLFKATSTTVGGDVIAAYSLAPLVAYPGAVGCASADAANTTLGNAVRVAVLANDTAPAGGSWDGRSVQVDPVDGGRLAVDPADGSVIFTPDAGFAGTVAATYRVSDSWGGVAQAPITVTVDGGCTITGTPGVVAIDGTAGDDVICVPDPSDPTAFHRIDARAGNDVVLGGAGIEWVTAGAGTDVIYGRGGADRLDGGAGVDTIDGGDGFDTILSADLADMIIDDADGYELILTQALAGPVAPVAGHDAAHVVRGETLDVSILDNDYDPDGNLVAASVSITATPTLGTAQVIATAESDVAIRYVAGDSDGVDTFTYEVCDTLNACVTARVTVTVGTSHCTIVGTAGDDTLSGTPGPDIICGLSGNDVILGLGGDDILVGGGGDDTLRGGDGGDGLFGGVGDDDLYGGTGTDVLWGGHGRDALEGNSDDDVLHGGPGVDGLIGGGGNDALWGGAGGDSLIGHGGNDALNGGLGDDILVGGVGEDTLRGGAGDDSLTGSDGNDTLFGGAGNDTLSGNSQNDTLHGGPGDDTLHGGGHNDALIGNAGDDTLRGNAGDDRLFGDWGTDTLDGGNGDDYLHGGEGADTCRRGPTIARCEP